MFRRFLRERHSLPKRQRAGALPDASRVRPRPTNTATCAGAVAHRRRLYMGAKDVGNIGLANPTLGQQNGPIIVLPATRFRPLEASRRSTVRPGRDSISGLFPTLRVRLLSGCAVGTSFTQSKGRRRVRRGMIQAPHMHFLFEKVHFHHGQKLYRHFRGGGKHWRGGDARLILAG